MLLVCFLSMKYFVENKILGGGNLLQILEEIKRKMLATRLNSSGIELIIFQEKMQIFFSESSCPAGNS